MMGDLIKMFMAASASKRNDNPPGFVDRDTVYAWLGNSVSALTGSGGSSGGTGGGGYEDELDPIIPLPLDEYPRISQDGRCLVFDGNCGMQVSGISIPLPITIEFYAYNRSFIDWSCLVYFTQNGLDSKKMQIGLQSDYFKGEVKDGATYSKTIQSATTAQNKWQHYAIVLTTAGHRMYINGTKVAENVGTVSPTLELNRLNIGCKSSTNDYPWIGALYQVRVSRIERYTDNFAVDLFDMPIPTTGKLELGYTSSGLIAHYDGISNTQAGHGAGKTWVDLSGGNNHLSMSDAINYGSTIGFDANSFFSTVDANLYWWVSAIVDRLGTLTEYTIEFIGRPDADGTSGGRDLCGINGQGANPYTMGGMELYLSGALWYEAVDNNVYANFKTETIAIGQKLHAAVVFKNAAVGQTGKVAYKNGVEIGTANRLGTTLTRISKRINVGGGTSFNTAPQKFVGHIYAVRIYDRALTAAEVAANYQIDKARFGL